MNFRSRPSLFVWALCAAVAVAISGCHSDKKVIPVAPTATPTVNASESPSAGPSSSPTPSPTPSNFGGSASTNATINPAGGLVTLSTGGFGGTFVYPANNAGASAGLGFTIETVAPSNIPQPGPTGTPFLYFEVRMNPSVQFDSGLVVSPVTVPSSVQTVGVNFAETIYDATVGSQLGPTLTGTVNGQQITFSPTSGVLMATAFDDYQFIISTY